MFEYKLSSAGVEFPFTSKGRPGKKAKVRAISIPLNNGKIVLSNSENLPFAMGYQQNVSPLKYTIANNSFVNNQNPAKILKDTEINDLYHF